MELNSNADKAELIISVSQRERVLKILEQAGLTFGSSYKWECDVIYDIERIDYNAFVDCIETKNSKLNTEIKAKLRGKQFGSGAEGEWIEVKDKNDYCCGYVVAHSKKMKTSVGYSYVCYKYSTQDINTLEHEIMTTVFCGAAIGYSVAALFSLFYGRNAFLLTPIFSAAATAEVLAAQETSAELKEKRSIDENYEKVRKSEELLDAAVFIVKEQCIKKLSEKGLLRIIYK